MYKVVRKNKSYDKRKLVIYDNNDKKIVEATPWGGWFCWSNSFPYKTEPDSWKICRLEVLKNLYWLIGEDCDEFEWNRHIEKLDSGSGVDGKTIKTSQFYNIDEKIQARLSFNNK